MKRMGNFFAKKRALFAGMLAIGLVGVSCGLMPAHTEAKVNFDGVFDFDPTGAAATHDRRTRCTPMPMQ